LQLGGSRGAAELQAGRLDVMHVGLSSVIRVNRAGGDIRTIGSLSNVIRFTFFGAPGVKTAADLKGGIVGVSSFGSESDSTVTLAVQRLGLARNDVTVKEYGGGMRRLEALKSGEIKATAINEPIASLARSQGVNVLVDLVPEQIPWVFSSIVVRRGDIAGRRDVLMRFLKGTIEGNYLALTDETRAKDVLAKELKITDPKILDIAYSDFKAQSPINIEISRQGAGNILAQFPGGSQKPEDYLDSSLIDALRTEGYFAAMAQKYKR
jgi:NitT/TauT family transport system substrate-binding protein